MSFPADKVAVEAAAGEGRTGIERAITNPADLEADPVTAEVARAFSAFQTTHREAGEYEQYALFRLGHRAEAEAEGRCAYRIEQNRPWFRALPDSTAAIAAATQAAATARERAAQHLLSVRLEQLLTQTPDRARTRQGSVPWSQRLASLADRPLDGDTTGAVVACRPG
ncbi:hypothetical protein [Streptomyces niveus]